MGRHRDREVARRYHRHRAHRDPEGEQLLSGISLGMVWPRRVGLPEEEVARIDDLLDLAQRFGVGLAQLPGDQAGQCLLVGLDDAADGGNGPAADRCRDIGPRLLRLLRWRTPPRTWRRRQLTSATRSVRRDGFGDLTV
jgi:hypothetical protein